MASENITLEALWNRLGNIESQNAGNHNEVKTKLESIHNNFDSVTGVLSDHTNQLGRLDYEKRRRNIVVFGVAEEQTNLENVIMTLFSSHMKIAGFSLMEVDFCKRLGKQPNPVRPRPILVGLTTERRKTEILKNSGCLKGTAIFVKQDSSLGSRETHKRLREERNKLRNQGKNAFIRSGKIICEDNNYNNLQGMYNQMVGSSGLNQNNKRAPSISPSDIPGTQKSRTKKTNQNCSEESELMDLSNNTVIDNEREPNSQNIQDLFSDTSSNLSTSMQSPAPRTSSVTSAGARNLLQSSIVPYMNSQNSGTTEKNL